MMPPDAPVRLPESVWGAAAVVTEPRPRVPPAAIVAAPVRVWAAVPVRLVVPAPNAMVVEVMFAAKSVVELAAPTVRSWRPAVVPILPDTVPLPAKVTSPTPAPEPSIVPLTDLSVAIKTVPSLETMAP